MTIPILVTVASLTLVGVCIFFVHVGWVTYRENHPKPGPPPTERTNPDGPNY